MLWIFDLCYTLFICGFFHKSVSMQVPLNGYVQNGKFILHLTVSFRLCIILFSLLNYIEVFKITRSYVTSGHRSDKDDMMKNSFLHNCTGSLVFMPPSHNNWPINFCNFWHDFPLTLYFKKGWNSRWARTQLNNKKFHCKVEKGLTSEYHQIIQDFIGNLFLE